MLLVKKTPIDPEETAEMLFERLSALGAQALAEILPRLDDLHPVPQPAGDFGYAKMISKSMSPLDWTRSAAQLHDQVRGLVPWPSASMVLAGKPVKVHRTAVGGETSAPAGSVVEADKNGLAIACGDGRLLRVLELQGEGGKRMAAPDYFRGHPLERRWSAGALGLTAA